MEKGLIHIYCGEGKGKTTSAIGLAIRCAGAEGKVLLFQFLKRDTSSERKCLEQIENIELINGYDKIKFSFKMTDEEKKNAKIFYLKTIKNIAEKVKKENFDLLILDEAINAINTFMIDEEEILNFLQNKPIGLEVVLTGRNPSKKLIEYADYVSEIKKIKHPFDKGISARKKIEY